MQKNSNYMQKNSNFDETRKKTLDKQWKSIFLLCFCKQNKI